MSKTAAVQDDAATGPTARTPEWRDLPPLVLASGSRYRARLLEQLGAPVLVDPPMVDERALDHRFGQVGAVAFALELARLKAEVVAARHPGALVVAGDQVGVLERDGTAVQLTKRADHDGAVEQLVQMSGTTHELVNGIVLIDTSSGRRAEGIDRQLVTMRHFSAEEAEQYVRRFEPFDSSGSYRLEDQQAMGPLAPFVSSVEGEHDSGVLGLPIPLLVRLIEQIRS